MKPQFLAAAAAGALFLFAGAGCNKPPEASAASAGDHERGSGWRGGNFAERFKQADTNNDGKISKAEMIASRVKDFAERDKNHDGFITADEMGERGTRMMTRMDKNNDGKIDQAEYTNVDSMFERMDKNGDGSIDLATEVRTGPPGGGPQ